MSKRPRLHDRLSEEAHDVLDGYRGTTPGAARRRANLEAVRRRISDEEAMRPSAAAAGLAWPIGWGVASAVAAAGLVWGLVELRSPAPVDTPLEMASPAREEAPTTPAPRTATPQPRTRAAMEVPSSPRLQRPAVRAQSPESEPEPAASASDLREETRMLRSVRASIAAGAFDEAAAMLGEYTVAFPDGALREDAQAYRVVVACKRGEGAAALRRAFARRYPDSPHAARIEAACGGSEK